MKSRWITDSLCLFPATVHAEFISGGDLAGYCATDREFALGYVAGIADYQTVVQTIFPSEKAARKVKPYLCLAPDLTNAKLLDLVCTYLKDHPETRDYGAEAVVHNAIIKASPCK